MLLLGVSGGMVPCPTAIAILLAFFGLGLAHVGFVVIVAFSVGLAAVLIGLGVAMVLARNFVVRAGGDATRLAVILPKVSGFFVTLVGIAIVLVGLDTLGVITIHAGRDFLALFG
jgi:ABC-type nickel/cobalt efflux system permease component RcnA